MPQGNTLKVSQQPQRLSETTTMETSKGFTSLNTKENKMMTATDKFSSIYYPLAFINVNMPLLANSVSAKQFMTNDKSSKEVTGTINQGMMQTSSTKELSKTNTQK